MKTTKEKIDSCIAILEGSSINHSQIEQITIGLIYKFMDDMDKVSIDIGEEAKHFSETYEKYSWANLLDAKWTALERQKLYTEAIEKMAKNSEILVLYRELFKAADLSYQDTETLTLILKTIDEFCFVHSDVLQDAFKYLDLKGDINSI